MKTLLVTGGAGFIGGTFVRRLVGADAYRIVNLDLLTYAGNLASLRAIEGSSHHIFVHGDIRDACARPAVVGRIRAVCGVVHFAAESHVDRSIGAPATFIDTNVVGTQSMLEATRGYWSQLAADDRSSFAFCMSPPTKSTDRWERPVVSPRNSLCSRIRPILPPRPRRIISCGRITTRTAYPC